MRYRLIVAILGAGAAIAAAADDRADFNRRVAEADMAMFKQLDLNGDNRLAYEEAASAVDFVPRFHDIDINRDGISPDEMRRYIEQTYGVKVAR